MSVCLRKLPKIGLSVVPAFAYIPPLRSGTAAPPLLSLPYVRFICFAVVYAKLNRIYSTFLLYRKYRLLSETQRFYAMKTRILFLCFFIYAEICAFFQEDRFYVISLQRTLAVLFAKAKRLTDRKKVMFINGYVE